MNEKLEYYLSELEKNGATKDLLKQIEEDRELCIYDHPMPCKLCSCGCFKQLIWSKLEDDNYRTT